MKLGIKDLALQDLKVMQANLSTAVPILEKGKEEQRVRDLPGGTPSVSPTI